MNFFHKIQNFRQISDLFSQIWLKKRHTSLFSGIWREIRKKIHQKFAEKTAKFEFFPIELLVMKFINSIAKKFWRFLTKNLRLENGAKECSARAFQRVFTCKTQRRYSRKRAPRSLGENSIHFSFASLLASETLRTSTHNPEFRVQRPGYQTVVALLRAKVTTNQCERSPGRSCRA